MPSDYDFFGFKRPSSSFDRAMARGEYRLAEKLLENDKWLAEREHAMAKGALVGCFAICVVAVAIALGCAVWSFL